jgi:hypothetical protein|tara:strand:- start:8029 stop:8328 length:300 start_codon:yes stop_codon:yes gene_type:complete
MAIESINLGSSVNAGNGDPLRTAFTKINNNFTEVDGRLVVLESGTMNTDINGSVFGDDSTLLVDGVNNIVPGYVSIASLKAETAAATDFADYQARIAGL